MFKCVIALLVWLAVSVNAADVMNRVFTVAAEGYTRSDRVDFAAGPRPAYPLYTISAINGDNAGTAADRAELARGWRMLQVGGLESAGSQEKWISPEEMDEVRARRPDFTFVKYFNLAMVSTDDAMRRAEENDRLYIHYFKAGRLNESIPSSQTTFSISEDQNAALELVASSIDGEFSVDTSRYVTWIRVGDECMRINAWDPAERQITVTRGWGGTTAAAHPAGAAVFAPVYGSDGTHPGGQARILRYRYDPQFPARWDIHAEALETALADGYDGAWFDLTSTYPMNPGTMKGTHLRETAADYWDFLNGQPYERLEYALRIDAGFHQVQRHFSGYPDGTPLIIANHVGPPSYRHLYRLLDATPEKPRPLDGFCQENFIVQLADAMVHRRESGGVEYIWPEVHSRQRWRSQVNMLMDAARNNRRVMPMLANAGNKTVFYEYYPRAIRDRLEMYGYCSYLMAVEGIGDACPVWYGVPAYYIDEHTGERFAWLHPRYTWPIGAPVETRENINDYRVDEEWLFRRRFENGWVYVNASSDETYTFQLQKPLHDPASGTSSTRFELTPMNGLILLENML